MTTTRPKRLPVLSDCGPAVPAGPRLAIGGRALNPQQPAPSDTTLGTS